MICALLRADFIFFTTDENGNCAPGCRSGLRHFLWFEGGKAGANPYISRLCVPQSDFKLIVNGLIGFEYEGISGAEGLITEEQFKQGEALVWEGVKLTNGYMNYLKKANESGASK